VRAGSKRRTLTWYSPCPDFVSAVVNRGNVESQPIARNTVISYVRGPHDDEVVGFARRLISEGVPCDLDLFESSPAGGWSRWMAAKMTTSDVVLVVCSRAYDERFLLLERRGVGKGVTFESGMLSRRVLEAQGFEHGVIPIVFDRADLEWIPAFLRDDTYFVLPTGYDDLYRVLTNQPKHVRPALGPIRHMPPGASKNQALTAPAGAAVAENASLQAPAAVFQLEDGTLLFVRYAQLERENGSLSVTLLVESDAEASGLRALRDQRRLLMGWGVDAVAARVKGYREDQVRSTSTTSAARPIRGAFLALSPCSK